MRISNTTVFRCFQSNSRLRGTTAAYTEKVTHENATSDLCGGRKLTEICKSIGDFADGVGDCVFRRMYRVRA